MNDQVDRALCRVLAEIRDGLRHGHFEYVLTCDVIGHGRRRLVLRAGKSYQFVLPGEECSTDRTDRSSPDQWATDPTPARRAMVPVDNDESSDPGDQGAL